MPVNAPTVVFIGGGPRTAGLLERLAANRPELFTAALHVHVVEPHARGLRPDLALRAAPRPDAQLSRRGRHHVHRRVGVLRRSRGRRPCPGRLGRRRPGRLHRRRPGAPGGAAPPAGRALRHHFPHPAAPKRLPGMVLPARGRAACSRTPPSPSTRTPRSVSNRPQPRRGQHDGGGYLVRLAGGAALRGRRRGFRGGAYRFAAGCGLRGVGRLRRPARRVPRRAQLHHRRRLFSRSPRART